MAVDPAKARSLFLEAIENHPPEGWNAFLDACCGDDFELRQRAEALLKAHQGEDALLDQGLVKPEALGIRRVHAEVGEAPGSVIGPYTLRELIGEGGMGLVFVAEQHEPVRRKVALKLIKPGMDSRQVIARFEAERQALAMMEHPNIAKILDAGTVSGVRGQESGGRKQLSRASHDSSASNPLTPDPCHLSPDPCLLSPAFGRPYFVMELVKGLPITDYCDRNQLGTRQRLELFLDVCHAVQHAHQKGIIHRDLKPSNILVEVHDVRPVVKIIDFGISKAIGQPLTDKTVCTHFTQFMGTPLYMSPEQAGQSGLDVDTRTDIYALGVLLYELLTGMTPFDKDRLTKASYDEVRRVIREEEPPKPSTRLGTLGQIGTALSARRQSDLKQLGNRLRGELDWIVMKALAKDRDRRYATAAGLAEDLERYLRGEPVLARPPSRRYRLSKFVQRNRTMVGAAVTAAAALVLGTTVAVWQALVAHRAGQAALVASEGAKQAAKTAEAREAQTRAVLQFVEERILAAARPEGQAGGLGRQVTLRQAIAAALPLVDKTFAGQSLIEARLRLTLGDSFAYLGEAGSARDQYGRARMLYADELGADHPDTLLSMHKLANSLHDLGQRHEALKLREEILASRQAKLGDDHLETLASRNNLANAYSAAGRHQEALKLHEETLALRQAKLGPDHPHTLASMNNLAITYGALGRRVEARELCEKALALARARLGADHPETLMSMNNLANAYSALGRHREALALHEQTLRLRQAKLGPDHPHTLASLNNLAVCNLNLHRTAEALRLQQQVLTLQTAKLGPDHPDTLKSKNNLAGCYVELGRHKEALELRSQTLALMKSKLGPDHPDTLVALRGQAESLVALGRGAEAVPLIDEYIERAKSNPAQGRLIAELAVMRLRHFQQVNDASGCRATAELWEKLQRADAASWYGAACLRAVTAAVLRASGTSPDIVKQANAEADRAVWWLRKALAAGFQYPANTKADPDLAALRGRADFDRIMADLAAGTQIHPPQKDWP